MQEVAETKHEAFSFLPLPTLMRALSVCHTYPFSTKWTQLGKEQGLQKSQRIVLLPFRISLLLNSISEVMEEVMRIWGIGASLSGQVYKRPVFLSRDFHTLGRKGDLVLNWRTAYLKRAQVHEGRQKGRAEVLHTLGPVCPPPRLSIPDSSSQRSPRMLSGMPFNTSSRVFSVRYMQIPCPYSAKWIFQACSFKNSLAWKG